METVPPKPGTHPDAAMVAHFPHPQFRSAMFGLACATLATGAAVRDENDALAALRAMKIDAATITVLEH